MGFVTAAIVIGGLILMIIIHEGGHFLAAKAFGMKATEAFFGFGPKVWSTTRGETEYGVKAIPLGGYVRIIGMNMFEEVDPEDEGRTYREKPFWMKSIVVLAGIVSHFVVAFLLLLIVVTAFGVGTGTPSRTVAGVIDEVPAFADPAAISEVMGVELPADLRVLVPDVADDSPLRDLVDSAPIDVITTPANELRLLPGDTLIAVEGSAVSSWDEFVAAVQARPGLNTELTVERGGQVITSSAVLAARLSEDGTALTGYVGVSPEEETKKLGLISGVARAGSDLVLITWQNVRGLADLVVNFGDLLSASFGGADDDVLDQVRPTSPIGLARVGSQVDLPTSLILVAFVNVFVGLLNVLPLYPLDGGHFAVALYEKIRKRTPDVRKLLPVAAVVLVFIVSLGLLGVYLDIVNPLDLPG